MELALNDDKLDKALDKLIFTKRSYLKPKENENIKKAKIQLVSAILQILRCYNINKFSTSPNSIIDKKINIYTRALQSINRTSFISKILNRSPSTKFDKEYSELSEIIIHDNLEYIFTAINPKLCKVNINLFKLYRRIQKEYLLGLLSRYTYYFNEKRIRLNLLVRLCNHDIEPIFQSKNNNQDFLSTKEVYRLKIDLIDNLIKILKQKSKEKFEEILYLENNLNSLKKEMNLSDKRESLTKSKWEEICQVIQGQEQTIFQDDNNFILLLSKFNSIKKDFEKKIISKEQFEETNLRIQLASVSYLGKKFDSR